MQSLVEYEAEERRYQILAEARDLSVAGDATPEGLDATHAPPSYTERIAVTPWVPAETLPEGAEVVAGSSLEPIPEDTATSTSSYQMPLTSSPITHAEDMPSTDSDATAVIDSDPDNDKAPHDHSLMTSDHAQASGISSRTRPVHWGPSPVDRARVAVESSPRSRLSRRHAGHFRQNPYNTRSAHSRSRSRDSTHSRRPATEQAPPSRRNSGGSRQHESQTDASSRRASTNEDSFTFTLRSASGDDSAGTEVPISDAQRRTTPRASLERSGVGDAPQARIAHEYPPGYAPADARSASPPGLWGSMPNSPTTSNSTASLQRSMASLPHQTPGGRSDPARGRRNAAPSCNMYTHANYSSPTLYPNMVSAAGLGYGTPFGSPVMYPASLVPGYAHPAASTPPTQPQGIPTPSRNSTGRFPLATALDAMQSPLLGPVADNAVTGSEGPSTDVERFAPVQQNASAWKPAWDVFPLKVYRGYDLKVIEIQRNWDDEDLLRELGFAYDKLRKWYRKYFSVFNVWYVTMVATNQQYVFPQRVGPAKISPHRNMRMRYLLAHPEHMKGQREIMRALTERRDYGVEFVERVEMGRTIVFTCVLAFIPLAIVISYGSFTGDWPGAFGIGAFFSQSISIPLVALGAMFLTHEG